MLDRKAIEDLVRSTLAELRVTGSSTPAVIPSGEAVTLQDDREHALDSPTNAEALRGMLAAQPARIAVGRAGARYRTATLLRFRADHAAARDAVHSDVDPAMLARLGLFEVATRATDKRHFLLRPDAGRALSDEARATISQKVTRGPRVQVIYGDGLSAAALNEHLPTFHAALTAELGKAGLPAGQAFFVRNSRVKVMDEIARLVDAEAALFVCGERPGLGFADSLSAYYIYKPGEGATDANREVLSNINPRGVPPAEAARQVVGSLGRILRDKKSGVVY
jgi:ethanolamine ammonia-lyase small subunit